MISSGAQWNYHDLNKDKRLTSFDKDKSHGQKFRTFQNGNIVRLTRRIHIYRWNSR